MKNIGGFVKTSVMGGLLVVAPIALIVLVLSDLIEMLIQMTQTAATDWPFEPYINRILVIVFTIIEFALICFVTGVIIRTGWGDRIQKKLESIPAYTMIRNLTQQLTGKTTKQFAPAQVDLYGSKSRVLGFIVEELPDTRVAVFIPSAPAVTVGQVHLLPQECVERLDATLGATVNSITQWGVGTKELYK